MGLNRVIHDAFGNPTIVYRPSRRSKPTVPFINTSPTEPATISHEHENAEIVSAGSSNPSWQSNVSPVSTASTAQTSLLSSLSSPKSQRSGQGPNLNDDAQSKTKSFSSHNEEGTLAPIEETASRYVLIPIQENIPVARPSVATVESVTAAKVYFETHFNALLSEKPSPRSIRRKKFEQEIWQIASSNAEREDARKRWAQSETDHLRQMRVLKATSLARHEVKGISIAGYDVVRVLGKGSFGVVRLVTEKSNAQQPTTPGTDSSCGGDLSRNDTASEPTHRKLTEPKKEVYAMKVIRKSDMLRNCQEAHLRAERDFLVASEGSRWVVPLIASFQDNSNLYLVMEYMIGSDFLGLLLREDVLDESVARWYVAEMILCIEEAHRMKWIHRDVKPDNFLISSSGHLKISDFGLAFDGHWAHCQSYYSNHRSSLLDALGITIDGDEEDQQDQAKSSNISHGDATTDNAPRRRWDDEKAKKGGLLDYRDRTERRKLARSVVGTSQYMAPEVIMGQPYDGRCDWWSIGIVLYEVGQTTLAYKQLLMSFRSVCSAVRLSSVRTGKRRRRTLWYVSAVTLDAATDPRRIIARHYTFLSMSGSPARQQNQEDGYHQSATLPSISCAVSCRRRRCD